MPSYHYQYVSGGEFFSVPLCRSHWSGVCEFRGYEGVISQAVTEDECVLCTLPDRDFEQVARLGVIEQGQAVWVPPMFFAYTEHGVYLHKDVSVGIASPAPHQYSHRYPYALIKKLDHQRVIVAFPFGQDHLLEFATGELSLEELGRLGMDKAMSVTGVFDARRVDLAGWASAVMYRYWAAEPADDGAAYYPEDGEAIEVPRPHRHNQERG